MVPKWSMSMVRASVCVCVSWPSGMAVCVRHFRAVRAVCCVGRKGLWRGWHDANGKGIWAACLLKEGVGVVASNCW